MITRTRFRWIVATLLSTLIGGCGTSGSSPTIYPEVQFEVDPNPAPVTFRVDELVAGGVQHTFPADMVFSATGPFFFYVENAPPPYSGTFTLLSGANIHVKLFVPGTTEVHEFNAYTDAPEITEATVSSGPSSGATPATQEIRFDVCVPSLTPGTCFTSGDEGVSSLPFSGSLGDAFQTHLVNAFTPSIYFLQGARDNVDAVMRLSPVTGQTLMVQLFINGALEQTASSSSSDGAIIQKDL
jgi:hypothetical protein